MCDSVPPEPVVLSSFGSLINPAPSSSPPQLTYLPPPWGECEAKALGFFHVYSVTACRIDCETRYIVENCNCRMVHMPGREAAAAAAAGGAPFPVFTPLFLLQATRLTAHRSSTRTAPSPRWVGPHVHRSTRELVSLISRKGRPEKVASFRQLASPPPPAPV